MENFSTIKDKILAFLEATRIKKVDFFEATGIQASNFKGKNRTSQPGGEMIVKILTLYPELSAEWLMRGEGTMLKTKRTPSNTNAPKSAFSEGKDTKKYSDNQQPTQEYLALLASFREQATEIGRLQERIAHLERENDRLASDARTSAIASAG